MIFSAFGVVCSVAVSVLLKLALRYDIGVVLTDAAQRLSLLLPFIAALTLFDAAFT